MEELFPFAAGAVIGLVVQRFRSMRFKVIVFVVLCAVFGMLASYLAGELAISWGFVSVDMALVWFGALVSVSTIEAWRWRSMIIH